MNQIEIELDKIKDGARIPIKIPYRIWYGSEIVARGVKTTYIEIPRQILSSIKESKTGKKHDVYFFSEIKVVEEEGEDEV